MGSTSESSGQTFPEGFGVVWSVDGKQPEGSSIWLDRSMAPGQDSLSLLVFRGTGPFANLALADTTTIALRVFPALDEIWALFLLAEKRRGRVFPAAWEAVCRYAGDVRQGLWPDRVAPEHAVQAVYLAIAQQHLLNDPPKRDDFLSEVLAFCRVVADELERGARLYDDDLVKGKAQLERYVALLAQDKLLYQEDLGRAQRFFAELSGDMTPAGVKRTLPLLAITRPIATQFKMWARMDTNAPEGRGYPLLLIAQDKTMIVLSADPASRAKVGKLAPGLSAREKEKRGGQELPWYDGKDHGGTLVAAPREGTLLSLDEVVDVLKKELRLRPISTGGGRGKTVGIAIGAMAALAVAGLVGTNLQKKDGQKVVQNVQVTAESVDEGEGPQAANGDKPRGSKGDPLSPAEVINLIDRNDGPRSIIPHALIAGVCGYEGEHRLHAPCRDARAMRDLLIQKYGYKRENIIYLVDKPEAGDSSDGNPTAEGLKLAVEKFRTKFGDKDESSFLFYYSGHGGYIKGARQDYGVLQPAEFFDKRADLPNSHKGWDMQELLGDIRKGVPSRHVMLLLDCCYSGWAVGAKGDDELEAHVGSLWKERAEVVLTAASKGQRAWEDDPEQRAWAWGGHSVMTSFIIEGLAVGSSGTANADANTDHVVTDEELAKFVKERVPESVRAQKNTKQTPTLFRFDASLPKSGRFLFVPRSEP
ncbi:MAG TPA: caspase family protein [Polyangium sp.]|nr:caspase family protein [Polyangium sp.]